MEVNWNFPHSSSLFLMKEIICWDDRKIFDQEVFLAALLLVIQVRYVEFSNDTCKWHHEHSQKVLKKKITPRKQFSNTHRYIHIFGSCLHLKRKEEREVRLVFMFNCSQLDAVSPPELKQYAGTWSWPGNTERYYKIKSVCYFLPKL